MLRKSDSSLSKNDSFYSKTLKDEPKFVVFIERIYVGSEAERSGRLRVGDEIVAVNEITVASFEDAR